MRRRGESGQMIMVLALAFALFLFGVVALVADGAYLYVWWARVQAAAQNAAQAGANSVDPHYLYGQSGHLVDLGPSGGLMTFERGCVQIGDESAELVGASGVAQSADSGQPKGNGVRCVSDGCAVFASVEKTVQLHCRCSATPWLSAACTTRRRSSARPPRARTLHQGSLGQRRPVGGSVTAAARRARRRRGGPRCQPCP